MFVSLGLFFLSWETAEVLETISCEPGSFCLVMVCCRSLPRTCMFGNLFHHNFLVCIMDLCPSLVLKFHCRSFHILHRRGKIVVSTSNLFISCYIHYSIWYTIDLISTLNTLGIILWCVHTNSLTHNTSEIHVVGWNISVWIKSSVHLNLQLGEGIRMWIYHGGLMSVTRAAHDGVYYILYTLNILCTKLLGTLCTLLGILCSLAKFWDLKAPSWMIYHTTGTMVIYGITIWLITGETLLTGEFKHKYWKIFNVI